MIGDACRSGGFATALLEGLRDGLVFGYGAVDPAEIAQGLASLQRALADCVYQERL